jgi:hypothetical protein
VIGDLLADFGILPPLFAALLLFLIGLTVARWWAVLLVPGTACVWLLAATVGESKCDSALSECNGAEILLVLCLFLGVPATLAAAAGVAARKLAAGHMNRGSPG